MGFKLNAISGQFDIDSKWSTSALDARYVLKGEDCPTYKYIIYTANAEGDVHLTDSNWAIDKALIKAIRVETTSPNWKLMILQNDNGSATNDAAIPAMVLVNNGFGNQNIYLDLPYEDEDASNEVHLYYNDNDGASLPNFYVMGYELK